MAAFLCRKSAPWHHTQSGIGSESDSAVNTADSAPTSFGPDWAGTGRKRTIEPYCPNDLDCGGLLHDLA